MKKIFLLSILAVVFNCNLAIAAIVQTGECEDGITWTLTDKNFLYFSGNGDLTSVRCVPSYDVSVVIKEGITGIGDGCFLDWHGLKSISIPKSVTKIGEGAFFCCNNLTSITISANVTNIGAGAFAGCLGLKTIVVESGNPNYDSRNNCNAIIETASNKLIAGTNKTIIPDGITAIGEYVFGGCTFNTITIPNSVTEIGDGAFEECRLTSIIIPNGVTRIGDQVFMRCDNLASITIPNSVSSIGDRAFIDCYSLSITLPERFRGQEKRLGLDCAKSVTYY